MNDQEQGKPEDATTKFDFKLLEEVSQNKFDLLAKLNIKSTESKSGALDDNIVCDN
jgi:hypothetical protein